MYGSLKRGQAHHAELAAAAYVAEARTACRFGLRQIAGYPALVPGERAILGELYRVSSAGLALLDEFEGRGYARKEIELQDGSTAFAFMASEPWRGVALLSEEWLARE